MNDVAASKESALDELLGDFGSVVVAFSGGVDSSYLAARAHAVLGTRSIAVTAVSPSLARRELRDAKAAARQSGWNHEIVRTREMKREEYARNDPQRCYWCKTELFEVLAPLARSRDAVLLVGTNADDPTDYRPGLRAADEHGVRAPLAEVGLTKAEVRALSARAGLTGFDKPASPCLASRVAYGVRVTPERMRRIDDAEEAVRALGFTVLRVRDHGEIARLEVPDEEIARATELRSEIASALTALGWRYVALDLVGFRSGSLNEVLPTPRISKRS